MSAGILRKAAALMRERAEAASDSPWTVNRFFWKVDSRLGLPDQWWATVENDYGVVARERDHAGEATPDMVHIASWHPAVALAVADWLDKEAEAVDFIRLADPGYRLRDNDEALAVARAYLRESADV